MKRFKTHFCMVSDQAAPNLLPLLDNDMKPEKVVLMVTPQMRERAAYLEQVIKPRGIKVVKHSLEIVDDFDEMWNQFSSIVDGEPEEEIALNVTGGTKWMAIVAQEVFRSNRSAVFYVKVEDDKVLFLDGSLASHDLSQRIDLKSYLHAYGYEFRNEDQATGMPRHLRDLCEQLVLRVDKWERAIGQLNLLASTAESRNTLTLSLEPTLQQRDPHLAVLLAECAEAGLLIGRATDQIQFADVAARRWANGGWLESYVNSKLNELKGEGVIQDSPHLNRHIQRIGESSHNEVDVCFMARNRLHLIECKTRRMAGEGARDATVDTVYKLDSISDLGGLSTRSMLVSYRELKQADRRRAKDLNIRVVQGKQIQELKSKLRDWIQK